MKTSEAFIIRQPFTIKRKRSIGKL